MGLEKIVTIRPKKWRLIPTMFSPFTNNAKIDYYCGKCGTYNNLGIQYVGEFRTFKCAQCSTPNEIPERIRTEIYSD
jgi:hypothetical protein